MLGLILLVVIFGYSTSSMVQIEPRIFGGAPVKDIKNYPYIVSIQKNGSHICAGSILNKNFVVTATHCVKNKTGLRILVGSAIIGYNAQAQFINVTQVITDPNFRLGNNSAAHGPNEEVNQNDIAVLKLKDPLTFSNTVKCIKIIPEPDLNEAINKKEVAKIGGWGSTNDCLVPRTLQEEKVQIWTTEECQKDISPSCHTGFDPKQHLCTGASKPDDSFKGAALGDDGGPLVIRKKLGGIILHGKHEDAEGQCHKSTIYTKISACNKFLDKFVGAINCSGEDSFDESSSAVMVGQEIVLKLSIAFCSWVCLSRYLSYF